MMHKLKVIRFYDNSNKHSGIENYTENLKEIFNDYYQGYVFLMYRLGNGKNKYLKNVFLSQGNGIKSNFMMGFENNDIIIVHDLFMLDYDYRFNDILMNRIYNKIDRYMAYLKMMELKLKNINLISVSDYTKDIVYRKLKRDSIVFYPFVKAPILNKSKDFYRNYISKKYNIPESKIWIIHISDIQIRKNIPFIQSLFKQLSDKYILLRIGQKIDGIDRQYNFMNISEEEKYYLIKSSDLLILPSFDEGFGLPIVEALTMKIPVITSQMNVIREISGEIPQLYTNSINPENWVKFIEKREYENMNIDKAYMDIQKFINKDKYIDYHRDNFERIKDKFKLIEREVVVRDDKNGH